MLLFVAVSGMVYAQKPEGPSVTDPVDKVEPVPCFYLIAQGNNHYELSQSQLKQINPKWVKSISVWTHDEEVKKKEFECQGRRSLVLVTLKKKKEKTVLKILNIGASIELENGL